MDKKRVMTSAIAGVIALGLGFAANAAQAEGKMAEDIGTCTQKHDCKGQSACGSKKHGDKNDCGGKNSCKGEHVFHSTQAKCDEVNGQWMAKKTK